MTRVNTLLHATGSKRQGQNSQVLILLCAEDPEARVPLHSALTTRATTWGRLSSQNEAQQLHGAPEEESGTCSETNSYPREKTTRTEEAGGRIQRQKLLSEFEHLDPFERKQGAAEREQNMPPKIMTVGVQDMPRQNMLLWYIDYFQLQALENQQRQREAFSELPWSTKKNSIVISPLPGSPINWEIYCCHRRGG